MSIHNFKNNPFKDKKGYTIAFTHDANQSDPLLAQRTCYTDSQGREVNNASVIHYLSDHFVDTHHLDRATYYAFRDYLFAVEFSTKAEDFPQALEEQYIAFSQLKKQVDAAFEWSPHPADEKEGKKGIAKLALGAVLATGVGGVYHHHAQEVERLTAENAALVSIVAGGDVKLRYPPELEKLSAEARKDPEKIAAILPPQSGKGGRNLAYTLVLFKEQGKATLLPIHNDNAQELELGAQLIEKEMQRRQNALQQAQRSR